MTAKKASKRSMRQAAKGRRISMGTLLVFCLIVLLIALGIVGYGWYKTRSNSALREQQYRDAEDAKKKAEIAQKLKDVELQKQGTEKLQREIASKLTDAKNNRSRPG